MDLKKTKTGENYISDAREEKTSQNFQNTYVTRFRHKSLALCLVRFLVTNAITEDLLAMFPDALVITSAIKKQQVEQHGIKWVMRIK